MAHVDGATLGDGGAIILEQDDGSPDAIAAAELGSALASGGINVALITAGVQEEFPPLAGWAEAAMAMADAGVAQVAVLPAPMHPDAGEGAVGDVLSPHRAGEHGGRGRFPRSGAG